MSLSGTSLPSPVTQSETLRKPRFSASDAPNRLKVHWAKLKRRIGSGSAPDESLGGTAGDDDAESLSDGDSVVMRRKVQLPERQIDDDEGVDEVVVDNSAEFKEWGPTPDGMGGSDAGASPRIHVSGVGGPGEGGVRSDGSSFKGTAIESKRSSWAIAYRFCRWRVWPRILHFFDPSFTSKAEEEAYQREVWYSGKSTVILGAFFLVFSWVFGVSLLPRPWSGWNRVQYYILGPILSVPLVPMAILDFPRKRKWFWQALLLASIWVSAAGNVLDLYLCHYYVPILRNCANRDFQSTLYYASALPVVALFSLGQTRTMSFFASVTWILLVGGTILPVRVSYIRNVLNIALFQAFVLYAHYRSELASRRLWSLRAELKTQFKATQRAQINERKSQDSKRRFSAYIFHEVRVPLNTALLAVQNLEGANVFDKNSEHAVEYAALEGSLQMMSQVLNDVLDFNRMERGGFTSVSRPFSFHGVLRSICGPARLECEKRGLAFIADMDLKIDQAAYRAAWPDEEEILEEGMGLVMGDEMRLRQVINNLASNAAKFTTAGGKVAIRTRLLYPNDLAASDTLADTRLSESTTTAASYSPRLSANRLSRHGPPTSSDLVQREVIVVRIEVEDSGVGIRAKDLAGNRLFSAYVQTEIGALQGGKGTGLGLSLCRQIVTLSGGRLGVKSRVGEGSVFWVEMPFFVGPQTRSEGAEPHRRISTKVEQDATARNNSDRSDRVLSPSGMDPHFKPIEEQEQGIELKPTAFRLSPPPSLPLLSPSGGTGSAIDPILPRPMLRTAVSYSSAPTGSPTQAMEFAEGPLRVLTVDDDALTRRLMQRMMERLGCVVSTAENGAVALEMILSPPTLDSDSGSDVPAPFDITFLDNQMPRMSGLQAVAQLRTLGRDDIVVGVTANAQSDDQAEYIAQGATYVLTKPVLEVDLRHFLTIANQRRIERRTRTGLVGPVPSRLPQQNS